MLEYNQPIFFDKEDYYIRWYNNLNTSVVALRYIFPHNIGVEAGVGLYAYKEKECRERWVDIYPQNR